MTFDNRVMCLPRMVWSFVVLFMLFYTQIIPVSAASPDLASNLTVEAITAAGATVRWAQSQTSATFENYRVSVSPNNSGIVFTPGPLISSNATETVITNLTPGVEYTVSVRTVNGSDEGTPKTAKLTTKPEKVDDASITVGNTATTTMANLTWGEVTTQFQTYEIAITPTTGGAKANPASVNNGTTMTNLESLTPGTLYNVYINTKNGQLESENATMTFRTKPMAVDAGTITPADITLSTASVSWTAVASADSYSVAISPSTSATPNIVHSPNSSTTASFSALSPGVEYNVSITSMKGVVAGDATLKTFRTKPPNLVGTVVLEAVEMNTATATWTRPGAGTFTSYTFNVTADEAGLTPPTVTPPSVLSSDASPSVNLSNLVAGQVYTVSVSTNWDGVEGSATTKKFRTKPLQVSSIAITDLTTTTATITWTSLTLAAKYNSIYKYKVEIVPSVQSTPNIAAPMVQHPGNSAGVTGMISGTMYQVKVTTIAGKDSLEAMSDPTEYNFTAKPTPVTQNTIKFVNVTNETATAIWGTVSVGEKSEYEVSISPAGPVINPSPVPGTTDPPTTDLTNLVPGTLYNLTVITLSGTTESTPSSATFTAKPSSVTDVNLEQNIDVMNIAWKAMAGSTQSSYKIRYHAIFENITSNWLEVTETSKVISIKAGEKYKVEVIAISGDQSSDAASATLETAPFPPAEASVDKSAATITSIEVTWTDPTPASYFTKYIIKYTKVGNPTASQVEATRTEFKKTIPSLEAGVKYNIQIFTESRGGKMSTTSTNTTGTAKPNCDVIVTDLSTEEKVLKANFTASKLVFTEYKFVITSGPKPQTITHPKGTTPIELVFDEGVQPGNRYTLRASCVSNGVESNATEYFVSSVPAPVIKVEPVTPSHIEVNMTIYKPKGANSGLEITCSGPSPTNLNGCAFPKSRQFSDNTLLVTYDKLDAAEEYNFTIVVISNNKRSAPKIVTVKTLPGRPGPPNKFTASAPSPTSVELVWKTPIDSNGLISTYVVKYTGIYKDKNNLNLNLPNDKRTVTFDGLDPNAGSYYKTLDGLKGGYEYNLLLYGKTSYPDPGVNANTIITMPIAAPTLAANAKPPERTDTTNETSVTVVFSKAFNWSNGPILYYSIIVAENRDGPPLSNEILPERALFTWKQVWTTSHWEPYISIFQCDIFDKKKPCDGSQSVSRRKRSTTDNTVKVTIGIQDCKNKVGSVYCNGALRAGTYYQFRLRGYTGEGKYNDTPYSQRIPTKPVDQTGIIVGVTVGLIVLLFIVGGLAIFFFIKCRKAERERKYKESETEAPPSSPTDRNRPVRLSDFPGHHAFMHADTDFRFAEEYEDLKDVGITQSFQASEVPHNRVKNRFTNILPYDRSRVKLSPCEDEEGSDYINANYIPGFTSKREYIACQGPLASTKDDFWRMIWEQNCQAIVMLTRCVENGREKCSHYWPGDTDPVMYGDIEVVILNETQTQDYSITQFRLTKGEEVRRICHYHFMAWPDFSAPDTSGPLLRFLRTFREREGFGNSRPLCVHCSAGVGRSGTFITLDRLTQHMKQHDYVDIYGTVYEMRMHRRYMVQTEQQYIFIHRAILDIINDTEKSSPPSSPAQGRENPAFEDIPLNDLKISDDEGITLEVLS